MVKIKLMRNYPEQLTDEYEMLECISSHDSSETVLCSRKCDERLCIVKLFFSESPLYDFVVPEEIKVLEHPSIPAFIGEYKSGNLRYEIREYVPGVSLDKLMQDRELSLQEKDDIVAQLCDIIDFLHTRPVPVIHRDIKPQNIIISDSGDLYLIDFGIARTKNAVPEPSDTVICTTRDFSAPEQYGFMETDIRSDIYSFGQVLKWLYHDDFKELNPIINKCTSFDPRNRYSSIKDVKRIIRFKSKFKTGLPLLILILTVICCLSGIYFHVYNQNRFTEPLIEEAVRSTLNISTLCPLTDSILNKVESVYIVADKVYSDSDEFYAAANDWYANEKKPLGNIYTLEDCAKLKNLKQLCIVGENLADLSPLESCSKLEKIEIKNNSVSDISILGNLPNLSSVGINSNPVTDIQPLASLEKLRYLDICNVKISDASVLEKFGDFEYLDIDNGTQAYMYLSGKSIHRLRLGNIYTKDLAFLKNINDLESVQLNFINYGNIQKLGKIDFVVIYEGIDVPVQDVPYNNLNHKEN